MLNLIKVKQEVTKKGKASVIHSRGDDAARAACDPIFTIHVHEEERRKETPNKKSQKSCYFFVSYSQVSEQKKKD